LIPDNSMGSVKAVDVAAPAGNSISTDCSHLYPPKGKFCEPSADWQNVGARVGGSVPTPRLLQFNITLVNPPSDRNCLIVPCISKLEDFHKHNIFCLE
jgi:hypothetical protein